MTRPVIALDVDLRSIYAVCSECGVVCNGSETLFEVKAHLSSHVTNFPLVLAEIAGPVDYTPDGNKAIAHNKRRWTIWNVAVIADLNVYCVKQLVDLFVSPSSAWTHGHDVKVRHALTKADAKNKDLRECQSMLWMFGKCPGDWKPLDVFLSTI